MELASATARSRWPLPKSPATIEEGFAPTASVATGWGWNVPSPLPFRMSTTLAARVGHGQVEVAGAEVAGDDRRRALLEPGSAMVCVAEKSPAALIGQDGDVAGVDVGDGQEVAVLAEVARAIETGPSPTGIGLD